MKHEMATTVYRLGPKANHANWVHQQSGDCQLCGCLTIATQDRMHHELVPLDDDSLVVAKLDGKTRWLEDVLRGYPGYD